jgi:hypothetical protein
MRRLPHARPGAWVKYALDLRPERDVVERTHSSSSERSSSSKYSSFSKHSSSSKRSSSSKVLVVQQALVASEPGVDQPRRSAHSSY